MKKEKRQYVHNRCNKSHTSKSLKNAHPLEISNCPSLTITPIQSTRPIDLSHISGSISLIALHMSSVKHKLKLVFIKSLTLHFVGLPYLNVTNTYDYKNTMTRYKIDHSIARRQTAANKLHRSFTEYIKDRNVIVQYIANVSVLGRLKIRLRQVLHSVCVASLDKSQSS